MLNEAGGLFYRDLFSSICFPCIFRLDAKNCKRINIGGCQAAVYLQRLLQLKYPGHFAAITLSRMEEILHEHSYIAEDYIEGKNALLITKCPSWNLRSELVLKLARVQAQTLCFYFAFLMGISLLVYYTGKACLSLSAVAFHETKLNFRNPFRIRSDFSE